MNGQSHFQAPRSAKRMRVGTKSCAECRRRKVRCIFNDGQDRCGQCIIHDAACQPQEPSVSNLSARGAEAAPGLGDAGTAELLKRLERTEDVIRMLVPAIGQQPAATLSAALGVISPQHSDEGAESVREEDPGRLDESVISKYLQTSLSAQLSLEAHPAARTRVLSSIAHILPDKDCLWCILQATQRYWCIWPLAYSKNDSGELYFPTNVRAAIAFVNGSFDSDDPGVAAKGLVWLCLCIQQLPKDFEQTTTPLPLRPCSLIDRYLDAVDSIVLGSSRSACSYDSIEAMLLQYKVFVNMGRPQRAWKSTRSALDHALLLGCHRRDRTVSQRGKQLWTALWQHDRHLSLFLGLPYCVPEQYIDHLAENDDVTLEERALHHLNIICGHIVDRDQLAQESSFSTTARIVEEMEQLQRLIPNDWDETSITDSNLPGGVAFWRTAIVLLIHCTDQWLHLPYVLEKRGAERHTYSRSVALKAAEKTLVAWRGLRVLEGVPFICDFLDFCAFTAALVLAVDLISDGTCRPVEEAEKLWALISGFTGDMKRTASFLDCPVAAQSAEVMEYISAARNGTYDGPDNYEVTIPCFGKMRIRRPTKPDAASGCSADASASSILPEEGCFSSTVEFNSNVFSFRAPAEFQTDCELGEDWTAGLNMDATYDWNELFNFN